MYIPFHYLLVPDILTVQTDGATGRELMDTGSYLMIEDFVSNLQLNIITASHTHCPDKWREMDYVPDYNKFYFIQDGEGWLKIGDQEYYPQPGQLFLMPAGILQSYSTISSRTFTKYWCHFTIKMGEINLFDVLDLPHFVDVADNNKLTELFKQLLEEQHTHDLAACLRRNSILMQIVAYYLETANVHEIKYKRGGASLRNFSNVLAYIQNHIHEVISTEELAEKLHYSPAYFTKMFKKYTGLAPIQYINKARLDKAKMLLKTTDMMVSEIAASTGFCDIFYFSKSFKKYTGFSPSDYRMI
jgi:AraC family transcriptional regulator, arabinose operon regulatory protein